MHLFVGNMLLFTSHTLSMCVHMNHFPRFPFHSCSFLKSRSQTLRRGGDVKSNPGACSALPGSYMHKNTHGGHMQERFKRGFPAFGLWK